jgi:putative endonuclease
MEQQFFVYILESESTGKHYIGCTHDLANRLAEHNRGIVHSTKAYRPYKIFYTEEYTSKTEALKRERFLKSPGGWKVLHEIQTRGRGFPEGITS